MGRDGKPTRDKILSISKDLIYENGFAGTSIDLILEKTGITKGAFFYHFKTKSDLARTIIDDFVSNDLAVLEQVLQDTEHFAADPKKRLLAFVQSFIDMFSGLEAPPSCMYAAVSNEQNQYSVEIKSKVRDTVLLWRGAFEGMIEEVTRHHVAKVQIEKKALADMFTVIMEGAFVVSKAINDPMVTADQLAQLKQYFDLLFED